MLHVEDLYALNLNYVYFVLWGCLGPEIKTERLKKVVEFCISQESSKVWIFQP